MKTSLKILTLLLLISNFSFAQDFSKKIDSIVNENYQKNPDIGISIGFIHNNQEYYTAYGKMSKESQVDINKNSVFQISSITKLLTSNLVAQAVIDDKLKLDDYIDNYLPKQYILHEKIKNKIKISDLASHQSGLTDLDFRALIASNSQQPMNGVTQKTLADIINNCTELVDYGKYRYSTIGFVLLGQILETIYGKSYDVIIREKMITPLQMTNTLTDDFNVRNITTGYNPEGGVQEFINWGITAPAGLVKSSASDMITFLKAVLNKGNAIANAALLAEKVHYSKDGRELGLATNIITDDKNTIYLKTGDSMGQTSIICYNRAANWGIIILMNKRVTKMKLKLFTDIYENILK
ncbi:MAG: serine hydrolase domain-containing protein [Winogradskyella sp.]|uniref:serine hydrolase domain-containing protein n=1 Tax=Winogradskyella sp. TaxID=1883156 RepID=UPI00385C9066